MLKLIRLFGLLFSLSLRRSLAFRGNLAFEIGFAVLTLSASLIALGMVFTRTDDLNGWRPGETVILLGVFQLVSGLRATFVEPNVQWFNGKITTGRLDEVLVQPAPAIFLITLGSCAPLALAQVVFGAGVIVFGIQSAGQVPTVSVTIGFLVLVAAATAVMWATRVMTAAVALWALGLELGVAYDAVWQFARYPIGVYPVVLQIVFSYVLPIAFVATVPADILRGADQASLIAVLVALIVSLAACVLAWLVWRRGLQRYTSATS